jgi:two-component system, chemotaxis family, chemotaxis protein CheY
MKILIVDDSMFMRMVVKNAIKGNNREFIEAKDGAEAIEMHQQHNPDLTFMDILMPGINGIQALRKIKERSAKSVVVMCTSVGGQDAFVKEAVSAGANQIVCKPFKPEELQHVVEHFEKTV